MTVNASPFLGGTVTGTVTPPVTPAPGAALPATAEAVGTDAMSVFLAMLTGMTPPSPAADALPQTLAATEADAEPDARDPAVPANDAAAQALIASLTPALAAPPTPTPAAVPAESSQAAAAESAEAPSAAVLVAAAFARVTDKGAGSRGPAATAPVADAAAATAFAIPRDAALEAALLGAAAEGDVDAVSAAQSTQAAASAATAPATGGANINPLANPLSAVSSFAATFAQGAANDAPAQPALQHPVGSARWAEELGSRITLMASQGQQSGSLRLTPEHLGPLEVQIDIKQDVATVYFGSQHADTRAALQDALPRLREMFATSGLVLGDSGVSRDTPRQDARAAEARRFDTQRQELSSVGGELRGVQSMTHVGLLDTYA